MKKLTILFLTMALLMGFLTGGGQAADRDAITLTLMLEPNDAVSATTGAGTSNMVIVGPNNYVTLTQSSAMESVSGVTASGTSWYVVKDLHRFNGNFTVQLEEWTWISGLTPTSFTLYYKESLVNDYYHWTQSPAVNIISAMLPSGNSFYAVPFYPNYTRFLRFYFTNASAIGGANTHTARFKVMIN